MDVDAAPPVLAPNIKVSNILQEEAGEKEADGSDVDQEPMSGDIEEEIDDVAQNLRGLYPNRKIEDVINILRQEFSKLKGLDKITILRRLSEALEGLGAVSTTEKRNRLLTVMFTGDSGVGKSFLLNLLCLLTCADNKTYRATAIKRGDGRKLKALFEFPSAGKDKSTIFVHGFSPFPALYYFLLKPFSL